MTPGGRIVGFTMLTVGVALFATFSGFLAKMFLSTKRAAPAATREEEPDLAAALLEVERLHAQQQAALERLRTTVAALDQAL